MINPDKAYSTAQAAELLGLSVKTIRAMCETGELPGAFSHKKPDGKTVGAWRIPGDDINAYRHKHGVKRAA